MNNTLKHIGLQIKETDLPFYFEILSCTREKSFIMTNREALTIFNIDTPAKVIYVMLEDLKLELFITNTTGQVSFNHICIQTKNPQKTADMARDNGYKTYTRVNEGNSTFFIQDSSNNIFEIKDIK